MPTSSKPESAGQPLDLDRLKALLPARRELARDILILDRCRSSNDEARQRLSAGQLGPSTLLVAETQTGGRGRRRRDWWSGPPHTNLALTLVTRPQVLGGGAQAAPAVGLVGAVALADAVETWPGRPSTVALKWPNDLLLGGAKLAGFLGEQVTGPDGSDRLFLGLGINLRQAPPSDVAPYPCTSLADDLCPGEPVPWRGAFLAAWLWRFERRLREFQQAGPAAFEARFLELLRRWAPHGVREAEGSAQGPLLEFSLADGLAWGPAHDPVRRPLGWLSTLEALP